MEGNKLTLKKILNIVDYSNKSGLGHLSRTLELNKIFDKRSKFFILTKKKILYKKKNIINYVNELNNFLKKNNTKFHYCIIDSYNISFTQEKKIKNMCDNLVTIDDFQKRNFASDFLLNYSPLVKRNHYKKRCKNKTKFLIGNNYNYMQLPSNDTKMSNIKKKNLRLFIYLGNKDRSFEIRNILKKIYFLGNIKDVLIINQKFNIKEFNFKIKFKKNLKNSTFLNEMSKSDILILTSGVVASESINMKKKVFLTFVSNNQKQNFTYYTKNKNASNLTSFLKFINRPMHLINFDLIKIKERKIDNYNKIINIKNYINPLKDKKNNKIILKLYNSKFCKQIFSLQTSNNRKFLTNKSTFSYAEHKRYISNFLKESNNFIFLIIIKNNFAGYIKFSYIKNYHDISIILKDKFRNRNIATSVLKYFRYNKILPFQIKAKVNKQNISSIKTFTKAGFKLNNDLRIIN